MYLPTLLSHFHTLFILLEIIISLKRIEKFHRLREPLNKVSLNHFVNIMYRVFHCILPPHIRFILRDTKSCKDKSRWIKTDSSRKKIRKLQKRIFLNTVFFKWNTM